MKSKGARGILISGGCDTEGSILNLKEFLPAIKEAHEMGLIIKLHTGLVNQDTAKAIAGAGVDIASMEMVGEAETVKHIFGIIASPEDYLATFKDLQEAGVPHICPHVCVGLHDGELKGEFKAIEMLASEVKVSTLAIIVLRPTKGTVLESIAPPSGEDVKKVVSHARVLLPNTKIIMGSLRPRASLESRLDIEINALDGGVDGIEVPSNELLTEVRNRGMKVKKIEAYGVLPVEYEERVRTSTVY
jgi:uncharacterized radical SAM superfamily protein